MSNQALHQWIENLDHMIYFTDKAEQTRILSERIYWQDGEYKIHAESEAEEEVLTEILEDFLNSQEISL